MSAECLVVVGPTAVGKSEFALLACDRLGGEVVSVDSMQLYRGLDRGTSKPPAEARARVRHHAIDLADPGQDFSMGDFVRAAESAIASILALHRLPVLVGGTGLYLRGLLNGMIEAPRRQTRLRERLRSIEERRGAIHLHRLLARVDPEAARRLSPKDRQRVVRALEVFFAARRPLSHLIREAPFGADRYRAVKIGLTMDREVLWRLIDARVEAFYAAGLVDEVRTLLASGCPATANAFKALGYPEALAHLRGSLTLGDAIRTTQQNTRRYAKRQWTWFRREQEVAWFTIDPSREDRFREPLAHAERELRAR